MLQGVEEAAIAGFNWPEMQFATGYWSGQWHNIDLRCAGFNGYPRLDVLCSTHFCDYKPWSCREEGTIKRYSRFPDYRLWHRRFLEMTRELPELLKMTKLARLTEEIAGWGELKSDMSKRKMLRTG